MATPKAGGRRVVVSELEEKDMHGRGPVGGLQRQGQVKMTEVQGRCSTINFSPPCALRIGNDP